MKKCSDPNQTKHGRKILELVQALRGQGYSVRADISSFRKPYSIEGHCADGMFSEKGGR